MLFNSYPFLFVFLPITLVGFFQAARFGRTPALLWLALASLAFYGYWNPPYLVLISSSITTNYVIGLAMNRRLRAGGKPKALMTVGVSLNLLALGYFKYAHFFVTNVAKATGLSISLPPIILPLAISFFTFQQISYLVDTYRGLTHHYTFLRYVLFVTFFPHLIAGPIMRSEELVPEFDKPEVGRFSAYGFSEAMSIFAIGLFKKVILADGVAHFADPVFGLAAQGTHLTFFEAWFGVIAYALQIYFDFSGYSDMAIGLGRMIGVNMQINFNSPYKSVNIVDFWRRWHITLSRFLRDYLYIPLGGNRKGAARRWANLIVTMVLGGLWHGAGWTFFIWGFAHGVALAVNHAWLGVKKRWRLTFGPTVLRIATARVVTMVTVAFTWVVFRAPNFETARSLVRSMIGREGVSLPSSIAPHFPSVVAAIGKFGFSFNGMSVTNLAETVAWLAVLGFIAGFLPNTQQWTLICARMKDAGTGVTGSWRWKPNFGWAVATGLIVAFGILGLTQHSAFLYFQF